VGVDEVSWRKGYSYPAGSESCNQLLGQQIGDTPWRYFDTCPTKLSRLMTAIEGLENPYQRTALLLVRWSGARRGEVQRLTLDCLECLP